MYYLLPKSIFQRTYEKKNTISNRTKKLLAKMRKDFVKEMERLGGFYHVPAGPYLVSVNDATTNPVEVDFFAADGAWTWRVPRALWDRGKVLEAIALWRPRIS